MEDENELKEIIRKCNRLKVSSLVDNIPAQHASFQTSVPSITSGSSTISCKQQWTTALPQFVVLSLISLFQVLLIVKRYFENFHAGLAKYAQVSDKGQHDSSLKPFSSLLLELHLLKGFHLKLWGHLLLKIWCDRCKCCHVSKLKETIEMCWFEADGNFFISSIC